METTGRKAGMLNPRSGVRLLSSMRSGSYSVWGGGEGGRSGGCVIKGEANRNASQPSGLIFYEMPLSPEDLLTLTVCPSARPRSQTRTFKIEELTEGVTFVACGFIS